jgi:hypothetical protein
MATSPSALGGVLASEISRSYNSFAGADIKAVIGQYQFAELQAINYSVTREKAPVYTMGSPDARAYSRNKRGIAGSLIWINFDRHALLNLIQQCAGTFVADVDEIRPQYSNVSDGGNVFQSSVVRSAGPSIGSTINSLDATTLTSAGQQSQVASPWYSDQVLPFDITLSGANEYGAMCAAKIFGVEILNEGFGISIDDAVTEMQATFVARVVEPMSAVASPFQSAIGGGQIQTPIGV